MYVPTACMYVIPIFEYENRMVRVHPHLPERVFPKRAHIQKINSEETKKNKLYRLSSYLV